MSLVRNHEAGDIRGAVLTTQRQVLSAAILARMSAKPIKSEADELLAAAVTLPGDESELDIPVHFEISSHLLEQLRIRADEVRALRVPGSLPDLFLEKHVQIVFGKE